MSEEVEVDALELFKSEMLTEDLVTRVECIKRLDVIAHALGKERTLSSFVPLISECIKGQFCSDDDEILLSFAKFIPLLIPHLPADSAPGALVPLLETLAAQDETVIREAAVQSLGRIAQIDGVHCNQTCFPALLRLFKAEWFSLKLAACGFAPFVYPHVPSESKAQIRNLYIACASDETPMVKRAAAAHLHELVRIVEKDFVITEFIPVYQNLAKDETQESIRSSCVTASVALCEVFNQDECVSYLRDTLSSLAMDQSWRVRLGMAKVYGKVCKSIGRESMVSHLVHPLIELMQDQEPDVRKAAVSALEETCSLLTPPQVIAYIVPLFPVISKDPVHQVRSALSACIGPLSISLGDDFTLKYLVPLLTDSVKDDSPTIRFNATASIGAICQVLKDSPQVLHQMVSLLHLLAQDSNWRTRLAVLEQIPVLCKLHGREFFESKLENLFLSFFGDSVHAVRAALTVQIGILAELLGEGWTVKHFLQKILSLYSPASSYSSRIAILQTLGKLAVVIHDGNDIQALLSPTLQKGCSDPVANVRFTACSVVDDIMKLKDNRSKTVGKFIKPALESLIKDNDIDVRYFASRAVQRTSA